MIDDKDMIIEHIHPLKEKVIALEKGFEYQEKIVGEKFDNINERMGRTERMIADLTTAVSENHDLVKKIWNSMWGGGIAVLIIWTIFKFILPLLQSVPLG